MKVIISIEFSPEDRYVDISLINGLLESARGIFARCARMIDAERIRVIAAHSEPWKVPMIVAEARMYEEMASAFRKATGKLWEEK